MTEIGSWIAQIIGLIIIVALAIFAASIAWSVTLEYIHSRSVAKRHEEIANNLAMVHRWFSGFRDLDIIWDYVYGKSGRSIDSVRYDYAKTQGTDVYGKPLVESARGK